MKSALNGNRGRKGLMTAAGIQQEIEVATPPQFPKGIEGIWSPEHLFAAAVSSSLMTTFLSIAENSGLVFTSFACNAKGRLEQIEGNTSSRKLFWNLRLPS